jgi:hypothetical protein
MDDWSNFNYAFPSEEFDDSEIVAALGIEQPRLAAEIEFKAPQLLETHFAPRHLRHVLSYDKGMGKTLAYLHATISQNPERLLIQCGRNATLTQISHLQLYWPEWHERTIVVSHMDKAKRAQMWASDNKVFISTPATLQADMGSRNLGGDRGFTARSAPKWLEHPDSVVVDEFHKWLRTRTSGFWKLLKKMSPEQLILSSGSAGGKGPQSLWAALNLCDPKLWSSYWKYVYTFCQVGEGEYGKIIGPVRNITNWRSAVSRNVIHRLKDLKDYPPKTRQALPVETPAWQQKVHDQLRKELMTQLPDGELYVTPNTLAAFTRIRQFLVCPKIIDPSFGWGAGLEAILEDVKDSELTHFVISTPFRAAVPLIQQFLQENKIYSERLMGSDVVDHDDMRQRITRWGQFGGAMVQTIAFAESYELPHARIMYMLGYMHDHEQNIQAEDRINRDLRVTPHPTDIYYVKLLGSVDEDVIQAMSDSADNVYNMMNRPLSEVFKLFGG